jgi:hypothetical protein
MLSAAKHDDALLLIIGNVEVLSLVDVDEYRGLVVVLQYL